MSCRFITPREDWESLFPRKKSDSSLSRGAGEFEEDDECDSFWSSGMARLLSVEASFGVEAAAAGALEPWPGSKAMAVI